MTSARTSTALGQPCREVHGFGGTKCAPVTCHKYVFVQEEDRAHLPSSFLVDMWLFLLKTL